MLTAAHEMRDRILTTWPQKRASLRDDLPFVYNRVDEFTGIPFFTNQHARGETTDARGHERSIRVGDGKAADGDRDPEDGSERQRT